MAASADATAVAARELADKITATTGPLENVLATFRNRTSLGALEAEEAFRTVEKELRVKGIRLTGESEATVRITVTLSENPETYLWVAEIQRDAAHDLVMVEQTRELRAPESGPAINLELRQKLLIEQSDPVLDVAFVRGDLLVLDPGRLSLFRNQNGRWALQSSAAIPVTRNLPRDPRGKLRLSEGSVQVHLPGLSCSGSVSPTFSVECEKSDAPWPLEQPAKLEPGKNSFVAANLPPFYTVASSGKETERSWILTGVDGRTVLFDDNLKQVGVISGWGSDIAGTESGCGTGRQIIVSLPDDSMESGSVQGFEIVRTQAIPVTRPVDLPGPVTALWPLASGEGAVAVSRDSRSGRYAAYQLSIACGP